MKTDLRVIKSKKSIEEAFIQLVEIKGFTNITLKEIAEKAVVNRNTIYLNYGSKEGILESIVKTSIKKQFGDISYESLKKIGFSRHNINKTYTKLFNVINENIELYRILLLDTASKGYLETEAYKVRKIIYALFKSTSKSNIVIDFFLSGVVGVMRSYIIYANITQEEAAKILTDLTIANLRTLQINRKATK